MRKKNCKIIMHQETDPFFEKRKMKKEELFTVMFNKNFHSMTVTLQFSFWHSKQIIIKINTDFSWYEGC